MVVISMEGNRPIKKWRIGNIECNIWENEKETPEGNLVGFKTISLRKSWRQNEQWHDAQIQLRRNDIQKVILLMQKAQEELLLNQEERENKEE